MIFDIYFCRDERIFSGIFESFEVLNFTKETHELEGYLSRSVEIYKKGEFTKKVKFLFKTDGINFCSSSEF